MQSKSRLLLRARPMQTDPWLELPAHGSPDQKILLRVSEIVGVQPMRDGGAQINTASSYYKVATDANQVIAFMEQASVGGES